VLVNIGKKVLCLQCRLKVDAAQEILNVIMTSNDENVCSCKRHTVLRLTFCFWRSLCPFLALQLITVSLDVIIQIKFHSVILLGNIVGPSRTVLLK